MPRINKLLTKRNFPVSFQTIILIVSLIFNCILIYFASHPFVVLKNNETPVDVISIVQHTNAQVTSIRDLPVLDPMTVVHFPKENNNNDVNQGNSRVIHTIDYERTDNHSPLKHDAYTELTNGSPNTRKLTSTASPGKQLVITDKEKQLWFDNKLFVFEDANTAFCVIEKNSCTMFKQIFKRIRGKADYLSTEYTKIHWLPYRGLEDISFNKMDKLISLMNKDDMYFAAFVRDPLERLVSGFIDKCEKKRGVNLCDYAKWSEPFRAKYGIQVSNAKSIMKSSFTPLFSEWIDGLIQCPCWPEVDKHFSPQNLFCNLYQYADKYDIFRFENRTHRRVWMERAGFWDKFGSQGWHSGGNDGVSIVDYGPKMHSQTNANRETSKYVEYWNKNVSILAKAIDAYRSDYVIFGLQLPAWVCDPSITKTDLLKRAIRSLPRTSRPPCDLPWLWIPP